MLILKPAIALMRASEMASYAKICRKKVRAEIISPARTIGRSRLISAAFPNMKEDRKDAAAKAAVIIPTSKNEAPRDLANMGMKIIDIVCEELARSWIVLTFMVVADPTCFGLYQIVYAQFYAS